MKPQIKPKAFNNKFDKPLPKKTNKPKVVNLKPKYKKIRSWPAITAEANAIGADMLIWMYGHDDDISKQKLKQMKRFPELNAEIEALTGKDPFIEYYKDSQKLKTQKERYYLFGFIALCFIAYILPKEAPLFGAAYFLGFLASLYLKIPYTRYFNEEDSARYQKLDDPYEL